MLSVITTKFGLGNKCAINFSKGKATKLTHFFITK